MKTPEIGQENPGDQSKLRARVAGTLAKTTILPAYYHDVELVQKPTSGQKHGWSLTERRLLLPPISTPEMADVGDLISQVGHSLSMQQTLKIKAEFQAGNIAEEDTFGEVIKRINIALTESTDMRAILDGVIGYYSTIN